MSLAQALTAALELAPFPALKPSDRFIFVRGYPVAPWIPFKPTHVIWQTWLGRLRELFAWWTMQSSLAQPSDTWDSWYAQHVLMINARTHEDGLKQLLATLTSAPGPGCSGLAQIVGHSVGALASLHLLNNLRQQSSELTVLVGSVIALAAADGGFDLEHITYMRRKRTSPYPMFDGLGSWALAHHIALLEITDVADWWGYGRITDGPYLAVKSTTSASFRRQTDGTIHDQIRRSPELVEYLWH